MRWIVCALNCWVCVAGAVSSAAGDPEPAEPCIAFGTIAEGGLISFVEEGRNVYALTWYYGDFSTSRISTLRSRMATEGECMSNLHLPGAFCGGGGPAGPRRWRIHGDYFWATFLCEPGGVNHVSPIVRMGFPLRRPIDATPSSDHESDDVSELEGMFSGEDKPPLPKYPEALWQEGPRRRPIGTERQIRIMSKAKFLLWRVRLQLDANRLFEYDILPVGPRCVLVFTFAEDCMQVCRFDMAIVRWDHGGLPEGVDPDEAAWHGKWTCQAEFAVDFEEPFHVVAIPRGVAFVTDSGRSYAAKKGPQGRWTSRAVWDDESRPLIAMVDVPRQGRCYAFGKDFYFVLSDHPKPKECRHVTKNRTDHGEPMRTAWECAKVLHENGELEVPAEEKVTATE